MGKLKEKLKQWLASKTEDCKTVSPLFSYKLDRKLSFTEKLRVRLHLFTCGACLNYVSNLKFMHEVFHTQENCIKNDKLEISLSPDAKKRITEKLKARQ
jgi:hypothetical protein